MEFQVDFEFKSRALSLVMGGVFSELVHRMVGAYEARANQLYRHPTADVIPGAQAHRAEEPSAFSVA